MGVQGQGESQSQSLFRLDGGSRGPRGCAVLAGVTVPAAPGQQDRTAGVRQRWQGDVAQVAVQCWKGNSKWLLWRGVMHLLNLCRGTHMGSPCAVARCGRYAYAPLIAACIDHTSISHWPVLLLFFASLQHLY
jgi:hypothetical protein